MITILTLNLESDMPTVDEARKKLLAELRSAQTAGVRAIKVIHGYGSTGVGGKLRVAIRKSLILRKKEGMLKEVVFGESWDIFDKATQRVLGAVPQLGHDPDLQRCNAGITIVLIAPVAARQ